MIAKTALIALVAATGTLGAGVAQAQHNDVDVNWSVTIGNAQGAPFFVPAPVVVQRPRAAVRHQSVRPVQPVRVAYRQPTRWDVDGDGIPNRYDRIYNPVWDVDGDGIPNRRDRAYNPPWDRDGDGISNRRDPHPYRPGR
jgi:hypothetical protein